jgi:hypothetical protein
MTNNANYWTDLAAQRLDHAAATPELRDPAEPLALIMVPAAADTTVPAPDTPLPPADDPAQHTGVTLHPRMHLALDELLDAEGVPTHNLAILVGRVRRVAARSRANETRPRADAAAAGRYQITDYGVREDLFRLEIQEVAGDTLDSAVTSYSMELAISHRLLESGLFADGQRLAICGPLRMERSYDARFSTSPTDPGHPDWTTRLEVITMLPVDDTTPDGSFVELIGVVEGAPRIRREPIGVGVFEPFASVRLRCRRQLRSGIGRSRAVFSSSTILPLEVPLSGALAQAGALLRHGNTVHIHGRLVQYCYQLPVRAPINTARADRKGVQDVLDDIATTARARLEQRQPGADATVFEREIRRAQQRFLTVIKPTIEAGYVELQHGTELSDAEIAELIAHWRPRTTSDQAAARSAAAPPTPDAATAALDAATVVAFPLKPAETPALAVTPNKPRRRPRVEGASPPTAGVDLDGGEERDADDAA